MEVAPRLGHKEVGHLLRAGPGGSGRVCVCVRKGAWEGGKGGEGGRWAGRRDEAAVGGKAWARRAAADAAWRGNGMAASRRPYRREGVPGQDRRCRPGPGSPAGACSAVRAQRPAHWIRLLRSPAGAAYGVCPRAHCPAGETRLGDLDGIRVVRDVLVGGPLERVLLGVPAAGRCARQGVRGQATWAPQAAGLQGYRLHPFGEQPPRQTPATCAAQAGLEACRSFAPLSTRLRPCLSAAGPAALPTRACRGCVALPRCLRPAAPCAVLTTGCRKWGSRGPQRCSRTPGRRGRQTGRARPAAPARADSPAQPSTPGLRAGSAHAGPHW